MKSQSDEWLPNLVVHLTFPKNQMKMFSALTETLSKWKSEFKQFSCEKNLVNSMVNLVDVQILNEIHNYLMEGMI